MKNEECEYAVLHASFPFFIKEDQLRQRDFSLFTLHFSLFTKKE